MRSHVMLGTVFSVALAVGASAQSSQPPTSQSPTSQPPTSQAPTSSQDRSSNATITVTGCLKADTSSPSSTSPNAPANPTASAAAGGFILADASASGSSSAATSPTESEKPSPTATSGSSSGTTYKLTGSSSDFASLVGKKVEVKGTVQKASAAGGGSAMGDAKAQQLRVTSVKEVSGSCSQ